MASRRGDRGEIDQRQQLQEVRASGWQKIGQTIETQTNRAQETQTTGVYSTVWVGGSARGALSLP
eukprot:4717789-Pyramimonas_sp.AAC.2